MSAIAQIPSYDADELIRLGYKQVSRAYRIVARLPEGMTGKEALFKAEMELILENGDLPEETINFWRKDKRRWVDGLGEEGSADFFRRVHANEQGLWLTLSPDEFAAFKARGGQTA